MIFGMVSTQMLRQLKMPIKREVIIMIKKRLNKKK